MPGQRRAGQTFIGFQSDSDFAAALDRARGRDARSLFIRQAVAEKLRRMGMEVSDDLVFPPDRAGRLQDAAKNGAHEEPKAPKKVDYKKAVAADRRRVKKKRD